MPEKTNQEKQKKLEKLLHRSEDVVVAMVAGLSDEFGTIDNLLTLLSLDKQESMEHLLAHPKHMNFEIFLKRAKEVLTPAEFVKEMKQEYKHWYSERNETLLDYVFSGATWKQIRAGLSEDQQTELLLIPTSRSNLSVFCDYITDKAEAIQNFGLKNMQKLLSDRGRNVYGARETVYDVLPNKQKEKIDNLIRMFSDIPEKKVFLESIKQSLNQEYYATIKTGLSSSLKTHERKPAGIANRILQERRNQGK
ncbi:MAG: hypothetical protein LBU87_04985 [Lactobacillales bacterium]|nr:hypothetical protein [Lactobacillales bacterium]